MKNKSYIFIIIIFLNFFFVVSCENEKVKNSVTIPFELDHNRMIVEAEIQKKDGTWRKVRLWVDSGFYEFYISDSLAVDLGIDISEALDTSFKSTKLLVQSPDSVRIGDFNLNFDSVTTNVVFQPKWMFSAMKVDGNLPATVLKNYYVIFDYPKNEFTIAEQGFKSGNGIVSDAKIQSETGVVQINAVIDGDSLSFALDNGASYSFVSEPVVTKLSSKHTDWQKITGTLGCANMWGWWPPNESSFPVLKVPEIKWGNAVLENIGFVGVVKTAPEKPEFGDWYSFKTAEKVDGLLGANALKLFRIEIDYANSKVYFEKGDIQPESEMEMVGISIRQIEDGTYQILNVSNIDGKPSVNGISSGDTLLQINDLQTKWQTMGTVINALRGKTGEFKKLTIKHKNQIEIIEVEVYNFF